MKGTCALSVELCTFVHARVGRLVNTKYMRTELMFRWHKMLQLLYERALHMCDLQCVLCCLRCDQIGRTEEEQFLTVAIALLLMPSVICVQLVCIYCMSALTTAHKLKDRMTNTSDLLRESSALAIVCVEGMIQSTMVLPRSERPLKVSRSCNFGGGPWPTAVILRPG
jgi:hypothetical protein